jgi:DNA-binding NarL/FixJ family response regulator
MINVHVKGKIVRDWLNTSIKDLQDFYSFKFHSTLQSLKNELDIKHGVSIVIIDVEDIDYGLFTKQYFGNNENIKFIGIGISIEVLDIIELLNSNISAYISINSNSLELVKSIKNVKNNKLYFCEDTKEQIFMNFISDIKNKSLKKSKDHLFKTIISEDIKSLTEKEKQVSSLLSQGLSYKEIAHLLNVTTFAINQNAKSIYKKLKVRSRSELSYKIFQ